MTQLSAYRILWIQVLFDLPTNTKKERKAASDFRNALLDLGFQMAQFSVYQRFCASKELSKNTRKKLKNVCRNQAKFTFLLLPTNNMKASSPSMAKKKNLIQKILNNMSFFEVFSNVFSKAKSHVILARVRITWLPS